MWQAYLLIAVSTLLESGTGGIARMGHHLSDDGVGGFSCDCYFYEFLGWHAAKLNLASYMDEVILTTYPVCMCCSNDIVLNIL